MKTLIYIYSFVIICFPSQATTIEIINDYTPPSKEVKIRTIFFNSQYKEHCLCKRTFIEEQNIPVKGSRAIEKLEKAPDSHITCNIQLLKTTGLSPRYIELRSKLNANEGALTDLILHLTNDTTEEGDAIKCVFKRRPVSSGISIRYNRTQTTDKTDFSEE
ncbi:MAG: hypothetical protein ACPGXY_02920 [Alphaproteobacteria bacterium]